MITVLLVDDQRLIRDGLKTMIHLEEDMKVVAEAANGKEALVQFKKTNPDVVLMDIRMPETDGVAGTKWIKQQSPGAKVIILTTFDDDDYVRDALREGADGYLLKDMPADEIIALVRTASQGGAVMPPHITAKLLRDYKEQASGKAAVKWEDEDLWTAREKEVIQLIGLGKTNREIAEALYISEGTVKNYVSGIMAKMGFRDRTQVAIYAIQGKKP
ncbi:MAG TPA: response regulator transcription factor [Bacillales bacterium]|nr:response regulator transcription factor [Bacillales bacterium]